MLKPSLSLLSPSVTSRFWLHCTRHHIRPHSRPSASHNASQMSPDLKPLCCWPSDMLQQGHSCNSDIIWMQWGTKMLMDIYPTTTSLQLNSHSCYPTWTIACFHQTLVWQYHHSWGSWSHWTLQMWWVWMAVRPHISTIVTHDILACPQKCIHKPYLINIEPIFKQGVKNEESS